MKRHIVSLISIALCMAFFMSACGLASANGDNTPNQTAAEKYLAEVSNDDIFDFFIKATYVMVGDQFGFLSPEDIPTNDLFRFAILADSTGGERWYNQPDNCYYIPLSEICGVLDTYFDTYTFDPVQLSLYAEYNTETETFTTQALGFGTGSMNLSFYKAETVGDNGLKVELEDDSFNNILITATIKDGDVKFLSCTRTDHSTKQ